MSLDNEKYTRLMMKVEETYLLKGSKSGVAAAKEFELYMETEYENRAAYIAIMSDSEDFELVVTELFVMRMRIECVRAIILDMQRETQRVTGIITGIGGNSPLGEMVRNRNGG